MTNSDLVNLAQQAVFELDKVQAELKQKVQSLITKEASMDKAIRELIQCLESSIMYAGNEGTMYERLYNRPDVRRWREVVYNARKILT